MFEYSFIIPIFQAIFLVAIGLPSIVIGSRVLRDYTEQNFSSHASVIIHHIVFYGGVGLLILMFLSQLGFQISALLGAAGILGIAVGFASQTSVSNVISGLFLLLERSFRVGDFIVCKENAGKIESIDLLSVRLRTNDGRLIRLPNEMLIQKTVINNSFYQKRRLTFFVTFPHDIPVGKVVGAMKDLAAQDQLIARDPELTFHFEELYPWGSKIAVQFWVKPQDIELAAASFMERCSKEFTGISDKVYIHQSK